MPDYSKGIVYALVADDKVYIGSTTQRIKKRVGAHKRDAMKPREGYCTSKEIVLNPAFTYVIVETCPCDSKAELLNRERYWIENYAIQNLGSTVVNLKVRLNQSREEKLQLKREWGLEFRAKNPDFLKNRYEENKEQISEKGKEYYQQNKEYIKERVKKYTEANKDKISERKKKYREAHKKEISESKRAYQQENKEMLSEKKKEYYQKNKDRIKEQVNEYREAHKEEISERKKKYREANKDKISQRRAERVSCDVCGKDVSRGCLTRHKKSSACIKK
jgi:hypothetical protein